MIYSILYNSCPEVNVGLIDFAFVMSYYFENNSFISRTFFKGSSYRRRKGKEVLGWGNVMKSIHCLDKFENHMTKLHQY